MAEYGLGNFVYEVNFDGKTANFKFRDPEDVTNVAEVSVARDEFPEGITQADSRQVADLAYSQVAKLLNDKRDSRLKKEAAQAVADEKNREAKEREVANDFLAKAEPLGNHEPTGSVPADEADKGAPAHTPTVRQQSAQKGSKKADKADKKK